MNRYYNPVRTIQGPGCIAELENVLTEMDLPHKRVLVLAWDMSVFDLPAVAALADPEKGWDVQPRCFCASNPTVEQLFEIYQETRGFAPDVVVAVGGGSIMDVGKSLCCLYGREIHQVSELRTVIQLKLYDEPQARWIGVPTTAGTGSETTCWATIWDPEQDVKRSVECQQNYAYAALVDPELASGMPLGLAVTSALDAVAHAVESYWAKGTNAVSRALALGAVRTIMAQMDALLGGEPEAHDSMARGSMMAGMAFSNTKTTACHSISYPLTMHYQIPHGAAVSMLLAPVLRVNAPHVAELPALLDALGVSDADELEHKVQRYLTRAGLPATLQGWGVREEDLPRLAQLGLTRGRADNNPVEIDPEVVLNILENTYSHYEMSKGA